LTEDAFLLLPLMPHPLLLGGSRDRDLKAPDLATDITVNVLLIVVYIQYKSKDGKKDEGLDKP